jgi:hypothetical protein
VSVTWGWLMMLHYFDQLLLEWVDRLTVLASGCWYVMVSHLFERTVARMAS